MHGGRRLRPVEERVVAEAPHHPALRVADLDLGQRGQEAARGVLEVLGVGEGQRVERGPIEGAGDRRRVGGAVVAHGVTRFAMTLAFGSAQKTSGEIFTFSERLPPPRMIQGIDISPSST